MTWKKSEIVRIKNINEHKNAQCWPLQNKLFKYGNNMIEKNPLGLV